MLQIPRIRTILVTVCVLSSLCVLVAQSYPTDNTEVYQTDPESLPPDTFRELALRLYERSGDKYANPLRRKYFDNDSITCNDGTTAGYYIRRNIKSKRWIIFLEGMCVYNHNFRVCIKVCLR